MIRLLLVVCLLLSATLAVQSLTEVEIEALKEIATHFPLLQQRRPPWNLSEAANACNTPSWFGLKCSMHINPRVIGLYVPFLIGHLYPTFSLSLKLTHSQTIQTSSITENLQELF
jgi:hypothetical protein